MCFQQHQHEANLDRPHALLQIAHCPSEFPIPLLVLGFRIQYQKEQKNENRETVHALAKRCDVADNVAYWLYT